MFRVDQNFKHVKFIQDWTDYCSLGQKHYRSAKILKIGPRLDIAVCDQSFTICAYSELQSIF